MNNPENTPASTPSFNSPNDTLFTFEEALQDVKDYLESKDENWFLERGDTKENFLKDYSLLSFVANEHYHCVTRFGNDREWSVQDAIENDPGFYIPTEEVESETPSKTTSTIGTWDLTFVERPEFINLSEETSVLNEMNFDLWTLFLDYCKALGIDVINPENVNLSVVYPLQKQILDFIASSGVKLISKVPKYKPGDRVKVIYLGQVFDTYSEWFEVYEPKLLHFFKKDDFPIKLEFYTVIAVHPHQDSGDPVYAIFDSQKNQVFLIGEDGIVLE